MTETTDPLRIPIGRNITYAVRGMPDVPNQYGPGYLAPTEISLTYRATEDSQLGRFHAYVKGHWLRDGEEVPTDEKLPGQHYNGDPANWPEWLAEEARLHDPDAAPSAPADQTAEIEHLRKERDGFRDQRNAVFATNEQLLAQVQESDQARLRAENDARAAKREAADAPADQATATTEDVAHALDNATPYPVELHSELCQFMAARLLEMLSISKRHDYLVWQPEDDQPTGPAPEPEDPESPRRMADDAQQAEPEPVSGYFVYTDADAAHLSIGAKDDGGRPVVSVVADEAQRAAVVYVLPEDIEDVVTALRDARRNAQVLHDEAQQADPALAKAVDNALPAPIDRAIRRDHSLCSVSPCSDCR
ncbi:hypothetical protein ACFCWG_24725 [Streptomyces sp. NPDC056390]|uniref:hypothetical protein n=1 Tax=Streptomyces sp. NPDC056390 TaxID=3345806 RepID=UPI0035DE4779